MASPANEQARRVARWEDDQLEARDTTRRHQEWTPRNLASSHDTRDGSYRRAGLVSVRAEPLSEATFLEMQRNLMQHIVVLEALIGVLLFATIVVGGLIGLRWRSESRSSGGRRGGFHSLQPYHHIRQSSDSIPQLPFHMQTNSSYALPPHFSPSSPQQPGKSTLNAAGYHTTQTKSLPKPPLPIDLTADRKGSVSAASTASTSTIRAPNDPFASPAPSSRSLPPQPPMTASILPAYPTSQLAHGGGREEGEDPTPAALTRAQDTESLLGDELRPVASSSTSRNAYATATRGRTAPSVPMSVSGGSIGTAHNDMFSASGTNTSGAYPSVSSYISRLQATSRRDLKQYTSDLIAQGWTTLDSLRGVTSADLRSAVRGITSTDAEFLARSVQQELDWIDRDRVRGGLGFRMVLSS